MSRLLLVQVQNQQESCPSFEDTSSRKGLELHPLIGLDESQRSLPRRKGATCCGDPPHRAELLLRVVAAVERWLLDDVDFRIIGGNIDREVVQVLERTLRRRLLLARRHICHGFFGDTVGQLSFRVRKVAKDLGLCARLGRPTQLAKPFDVLWIYVTRVVDELTSIGASTTVFGRAGFSHSPRQSKVRARAQFSGSEGPTA